MLPSNLYAFFLSSFFNTSAVHVPAITSCIHHHSKLLPKDGELRLFGHGSVCLYFLLILSLLYSATVLHSNIQRIFLCYSTRAATMKNRKNPLNWQLFLPALWCAAFLIMSACFPSDASALGNWRRLIDKDAYSVAINPKNPRTLFIGSTARRLYRSYDAGQTWDSLAVEFTQGSGWFSNIFVHPIDTNVIFVGGSQFGDLQRSTDHGKTWTKVLSRPSNVNLNGEVIIANPNNPDTMYIAELNPGIVSRSTDRGETWDSISVIDNIPFLCTLTMRADSTNIIFAGCADGVIRKSTDGGVTWRKTTMVRNVVVPPEEESVEIPKIVFSKRDPQIGYASATIFSKKSLPNGGIYRTLDGGETWKQFQFRDTSIWALDVRERFGYDEIVVGGFSDFTGFPGAGIVRRSVDNGMSWALIDTDIPWSTNGENTPHDVWMMKFLGPTNNPRLYMASTHGFFVYDVQLSVAAPSISKHKHIALSSDGFITVTPPDNYWEQSELRCTDILGHTVATFTVEPKQEQQFYLPRVSAGMYSFQLLYKGQIIDMVLAPIQP